MDAIPTWQVGGASNWLRVCVLVRLAHLQPTHFLHKINKKKKKHNANHLSTQVCTFGVSVCTTSTSLRMWRGAR